MNSSPENRSRPWKHWISIATTIALGVAFLGGAGCKQGQGERCQVDSDCDDGLTCSQSEPKTCGGSNSEQFDANPAEITPDAPQIDAPPDAPVDAPPDAPVDAPPDAPVDAPPDAPDPP